MEFVNLPLLAASALVFASVLTGLFSARFGFSFLLVFLLAGILAGEDGAGGYRFDDFRLSFWVGNLALAVILLDGGLRTAYATFRTGLRPASLGEFNPSSQHILNGGVDEAKEVEIESIAATKDAVARAAAGATSRRAMAVLEGDRARAYSAKTQPRSPACLRRLELDGFGNAAVCRHRILRRRRRWHRGGTCPWLSESRSLCAVARGEGVREIAGQLGRSPSTISREVRRNAATRGGGFEYRATHGAVAC